MSTFSDRFIYKDNITVSNIESAGPNTELITMTNMIRRFSILIKNVSVADVYQAVTIHADPEIALILTASKNEDGTFKFSTQEDIKQFMFGGTAFESTTRNLFVEGIRRISASFAAAELIHAFAHLDQHDKHAEHLKDRATAELDRILSLPEARTTSTTRYTSDVDENANKLRLYFEKLNFELVNPLKVQVYTPKNTSWVDVATYTGPCSCAQICADISDKVNELALLKELNLLAAPSLSSGAGETSNLHSIDFFVREPVLNISAEMLSIRFISGSTLPLTNVPFKWGPEYKFIKNELLNSLLFVASKTHFLKPNAEQAETLKEQKYTPIYLYFRNKADALAIDPLKSKLKIRISTLDTPIDIEVDTATPLSDRYSQAALTFINALDAVKEDSKVVGSIFRNDPPSTTPDSQSITVVQLIAWSATNPDTFVTVDVLEVPSDIEITLGDYNGIYSQYSSKPRSLRVQTIYYKTAIGNQTNELDPKLSGNHRIVTLRESKLLGVWRDAQQQKHTNSTNNNYYSLW